GLGRAGMAGYKGLPEEVEEFWGAGHPGLSWDHSWLPVAVSPPFDPGRTWATPAPKPLPRFWPGAPTARSAGPSALKSPLANALPNRSASSACSATPGLFGTTAGCRRRSARPASPAAVHHPGLTDGAGEVIQMRARMLAVMVTALVLVMTTPAFAGPREEAQARRKLLAGQAARAAVIQNGETKENLEQVVVNHFGNRDQGQVLIQTWVEPDWSNFEAVDIQAAAPRGQHPRA